MPIYEYYCKGCFVKFEQFAPRSEGFEKAKCPSCGKEAPRKISRPGGFILKGSGFHVNDYPDVDRVVGQDADRKWKRIHEEREKRDRVRRESGQHAVTRTSDGSYVPTSSDHLKDRQDSVSYASENFVSDAS